jgi:hypothetical protein
MSSCWRVRPTKASTDEMMECRGSAAVGGRIALTDASSRDSPNFSARVLTDLTGPFYTVVLELTVPSLSAFETEGPRFMADKDFQANYQKLVRLVESGKREIFTILE